MKRKMYSTMLMSVIMIIAAAMFFVSPDTELSASTRPSLADLQAQLSSLQSQIGALSPSDPFLGEIRLFGGNFAPRNWATCEGQLLPIAQNSALFSLLGTMYGGDGRTTFALPDLRGRVVMGQGNGPGLTSRPIGQKIGQETVVLSESNLPQHTHDLKASSSGTSSSQAAGNLLAANPSSSIYKAGGSSDILTSNDSLSSVGNNQPVQNIQPSNVMTYIIALQGIYPSRN